ncbi:TonB-dependent receptor [Acinetobacter rudis]|uniref:TonB-dependent receptor n=1 Tax=Acinetobacter rudis TaxID=632955 RepID=UPI00333FF5AB
MRHYSAQRGEKNTQKMWKLRKLSVVLATLLYSHVLYADDKVLNFNLAAQPLHLSVEQLAHQANVQILYASELLENKNAAALTGKLSLTSGLKQLLKGTDLQVEQHGDIYIIRKKNHNENKTATVPANDTGHLNQATVIEPMQTSNRLQLAPIVAYAEADPSVYDQPRSVSIISKAQLENRPTRHAADMLEQTSGVYSTVSQQDPALSVNIRGIQDYGRVNMNIDGMRQNFQKSGHGQRNGQMYIDSELISSVRIDKGATSGMGGAGAFGGISTFNTVSPEDYLTDDKNFGGKLHLSAGSNATKFIGSAILAGRYQDVDVLFAMSDRQLGDYSPGTKGEFGNIRVNNDTGHYDQFLDQIKQSKVTDTNYKMRSYLGKIDWHIDDAQRLKLSYIKNETSTPNASALKDIHNPNDYSDYYLGWTRTGFSQIDSQSMAIDYQFKPENLSWIDLKTKLYYVDTEDYTDTYPTNTLKTNGYWATTRMRTYGLQAENNTDFNTGDRSNLRLNYGVDIFYDKGTSRSDREVMVGVTPAGNRSLSSLFGNFTWDYDDWLKLQGGVRYDRYRLRGSTGFDVVHFPYTKENPCTAARIRGCNGTIREYQEWHVNDEAGKLSPTFAIAVKPGLEWLELFANYGQAWRPPAITETLTYGSAHSTSTQYPNPFLKPESTKAWEAGFNIQQTDFIFDNDRFFAKVAYFDTQVDDYINLHIARVKPGIFSPSIGNAAYVNNQSKSKFRGIEYQLNYDADWFYVDMTYTRMIGKNDYCTNSAWLGDVTYVGGTSGNYYQVPADDWNSSRRCNDGTIFNASAFLPGDRGSLTLGGRAFDHQLDAGVIVRFNPGYQDYSTPSNFPYLADWPKYTLYDVYANYKINDQFTLRGSIENLADRAYVVNYGDIQSSTLGRGRTFQAGLEFKF